MCRTSHGISGSTCWAGTGPVQKISGSHSWPSYCSGQMYSVRPRSTTGRLMAWRVERVDAAEYDVYVLLLDESGGGFLGRAVVGRAVLQHQLDGATPPTPTS